MRHVISDAEGDFAVPEDELLVSIQILTFCELDELEIVQWSALHGSMLNSSTPSDPCGFHREPFGDAAPSASWAGAQFYAWSVAPSVLLLDIDGTLVDNTRQHIAAWAEAFKALGHPVADETLRRNIGKGGDLFVKAVAGEEWDGQHGDAARELHGKAYMKRTSEVRPVPGVRQFLDGLRELEVRPLLASSSNPDEVKANLAVIGETPDHFLIVDKDDIETSKPAPDVFGVALQRAGTSPQQAAAVGDTRWDAEAAVKVSVVFYGVLTGSGRREELEGGGAKLVFPDLLSLLAFLRSH